MPPGGKTDSELLRLLRSDDPAEVREVFTYFLERYKEDVKTTVGRLGGNTDDHELILDDAILALRAAVRSGRYDPSREGLIPYFFGIVKKRTLSAIRQKQRRGKHHQNYRLLWERDEAQAGNTSDKKLLDMEDRDLLNQSLDQMEEPCRELLKRYWFDGEKLKDIAVDMKLGDDNSRQIHRRCLKKLREIYQKLRK